MVFVAPADMRTRSKGRRSERANRARQMTPTKKNLGEPTNNNQKREPLWFSRSKMGSLHEILQTNFQKDGSIVLNIRVITIWCRLLLI